MAGPKNLAGFGCCPAGTTVSMGFNQECNNTSTGGQQILTSPAYALSTGGVVVSTGNLNSLGGVSFAVTLGLTYTIDIVGFDAPRYVNPVWVARTPGFLIEIFVADGYECLGPCGFPLSNRMAFVDFTGAGGTGTLAAIPGFGYGGVFGASGGQFGYTGTDPTTGVPYAGAGTSVCTYGSPVVTTFTSTVTVAGIPPGGTLATMTETTPVP
jgi:hypothetical protein